MMDTTRPHHSHVVMVGGSVSHCYWQHIDVKGAYCRRRFRARALAPRLRGILGECVYHIVDKVVY